MAIEFNSTTPAAPAGFVNAVFAHSSENPDKIAVHVPLSATLPAVQSVSASGAIAAPASSAVVLATAAADIVLTLPAANTWGGRSITIKKVDAGAGVVKLSAAIDGYTEFDLPNQFDFVTLFSDGASVYIIGRN